jgi:hypothetical protein
VNQDAAQDIDIFCDDGARVPVKPALEQALHARRPAGVAAGLFITRIEVRPDMAGPDGEFDTVSITSDRTSARMR